jgi:hypothetical protein
MEEAKEIIFRVRLINEDWNAEQHAWYCPALRIRGATVREIYASGERKDKALYEILPGQEMIHWIPDPRPEQIYCARQGIVVSIRD